MRKPIIFLLALFVFVFFNLVDFGLNFQARAVLAITTLTALLWVSDILPLFVSGLVAAFLLIAFAGFSPLQVFTPFFDPVIALLLGGFVLAKGLEKNGLSQWIAFSMLKKLGEKPENVLLGLMIVTAFLSMWMSNTATAAIMMPIALVILSRNKVVPLKSNFGKATVLGIAFAANLGGIGTIVGTTPNAIAVKFLADSNIHLSFLSWMVYALPIVIVMLPVIWFVLKSAFKTDIKRIKPEKFRRKLSLKQKQVLGVFALTVFLWLTTSWHGVSATTIALIPIILLHALKLLDRNDFKAIDWPTLILVGAGLSIGTAIANSSLGAMAANLLQNLVFNQPVFIILLAVALFSLGMTAFAANTGTAAILVPIMIPLALMLNINVLAVVLVAAMSSTLDFIFPAGTPPNAIAYSTGFIKAKDMVKTGIVVSFLSALVLTAFALVWLAFML